MAGENHNNNEVNTNIVEERQACDVCHENGENQLTKELFENGELLNPVQTVEEPIDEALRAYEDTRADDERVVISPNIQSEQISDEERIMSSRQNAYGLALVSTIALTPMPLRAVSPPKQGEETPVVIVLKRKLKVEATHEFEEPEEASFSEAVAVPESLSFKLPKKYQDQAGLGREEQQPAQNNNNSSVGSGGDSKAIFLWSKPITFQLPEDIHRSIQIMDEKSPAAASAALSLTERLQGWRIREKKRDRRYEKTFHHQKSRRMFRSFLQAETFIVYAGHKQHLSKKRKRHEEPSEKEQSQVDLEPLSVFDDIQEEEIQIPTKEMIEKFHRDAWNNLLNMQWPDHL